MPVQFEAHVWLQSEAIAWHIRWSRLSTVVDGKVDVLDFMLGRLDRRQTESNISDG